MKNAYIICEKCFSRFPKEFGCDIDDFFMTIKNSIKILYCACCEQRIVPDKNIVVILYDFSGSEEIMSALSILFRLLNHLDSEYDPDDILLRFLKREITNE